MSKYIERLKRSKEEISEASVTLAEKQAKLGLEGKIITTKKQLATTEAAKEAALSANPFDVNEVIRLQKEEAELQATIDAVDKIFKTEFE